MLALELVEVVAWVARYHMVVVVKRVLVSGWFVVLESGNAGALISQFHGSRNELNGVENVVTKFRREQVEAFVVLNWHDDDVAGVLAPEKGVDDGRDLVVAVNEITVLNHGAWSAGVLEAGTIGADVAKWGVARKLGLHEAIIPQFSGGPRRRERGLAEVTKSRP